MPETPPRKPQGTSAALPETATAAAASTAAERLAVPMVLLLLGCAFAVDVAVDVAKGSDDAPRISARENRRLAPWPQLSWAALRSGSFTRGIDLWVSDHFVFREAFLDVADAVEALRGIDVDASVFDGDALGDFGLEDEGDDAGVVDAGDVNAGDADAGDVGDVDAGVDAGVDVGDAGVAGTPQNRRYKSGITVVGDRGLMYLVANDDTADAFADAVNVWRDAIAPEVSMSLVVTPTATHFYLPPEQADRSAPQDQNLRRIQSRLRPGVGMVDVVGALAPHVDEPIFFKTDHHWTGLGAYHAYTAWAKDAGFDAVALDEMEHRQHPTVLGSLYRFTRSKVLKRSDDPIDYWLPTVTYQGLRKRSLDAPAQRGSFIVEREKSYAVFLGGDDPLLSATTDVDSERRVLVVKNSFGNAFAPFLLPHFREVVVVDYRYYDGSLKALIAARGITDVVIVSATVTANNKAHARRLRQALTGSGTAWEMVTAASQAAEIEKYQREHGTLGNTPPTDAGVIPSKEPPRDTP
jgi:hypothetical protein